MHRPKDVAIIGAGLGGLCMALSLHSVGIPSTVYEARGPEIIASPGAIMLSPNAFRILEKLGVYPAIKEGAYECEYGTYKDYEGRTTDKYAFGHEKKYGYKALRCPRYLVLGYMRDLVRQRGIKIVYGKKFVRVVSEEADGVTFAFEDGSEVSTALLVGADGLHSKVREFVTDNPPQPVYSGQTAFIGIVKKRKLRIPDSDFEASFPVIIYGTGNNGAFLMINQSADGEEILAGTHRAVPEQSRSGWAALAADKEKIVSMLQGDENGKWPDVVRSAIEHLEKDSIYIWPYYAVPKLERWVSENGYVLALGDAAHAIPPAGGQGANQAFEDAWSLALVLANPSENLSLKESLVVWEKIRSERIEKVTELTMQLSNVRLPAEEREKLGKGKVWTAEDCDVDWLYVGRPEEDVMNEIQKVAQSKA